MDEFTGVIDWKSGIRLGPKKNNNIYVDFLGRVEKHCTVRKKGYLN